MRMQTLVIVTALVPEAFCYEEYEVLWVPLAGGESRLIRKRDTEAVQQETEVRLARRCVCLNTIAPLRRNGVDYDYP